jgi:argininosuccinate lyase
LTDFRAHSDLVEEDVYKALSLSETLKAKRSLGGTAPELVEKALSEARQRLKEVD